MASRSATDVPPTTTDVAIHSASPADGASTLAVRTFEEEGKPLRGSMMWCRAVPQVRRPTPLVATPALWTRKRCPPVTMIGHPSPSVSDEPPRHARSPPRLQTALLPSRSTNSSAQIPFARPPTSTAQPGISRACPGRIARTSCSCGTGSPAIGLGTGPGAVNGQDDSYPATRRARKDRRVDQPVARGGGVERGSQQTVQAVTDVAPSVRSGVEPRQLTVGGETGEPPSQVSQLGDDIRKRGHGATHAQQRHRTREDLAIPPEQSRSGRQLLDGGRLTTLSWQACSRWASCRSPSASRCRRPPTAPRGGRPPA